MASIPTMSKQSIAMVSPSSRADEEDEMGYKTDLSAKNTDIEINTDTSNRSTTDKKKLKHMREFHTEYQCVFGEGASIRTMMKRRISHMNPPMPKTVCEEEMQNAQLDSNGVIIEYITDAQGNEVKKLKPVFIKSEPDSGHILHVESDDNLPVVPEENFTRERERMVYSYSQSISSDDDPSDERIMTADSDSSAAAVFEETPIGWEADPKGIEATLHQIATNLQNAAEGYLALASHMSQVAPYELPQSSCSNPYSPYGCTLIN